MSDVLASIAAYKRIDVSARKAATSQDAIESLARTASPPRGFRAALERHVERTGRPALIAEIKKASPSKGLIRADFDPPALARAYERGGATCLSVLTDGPSFQGDDAFLVAARDAVALPCLRKDFLVDPWQVAESRALGADCILVILAMVDDAVAAALMAEAERFGMDALVETHDEAEMARACALGADLGQRRLELRPAVALERAGEVAGEAGGVQAAEHRPGAVGGADLDRIMLLRAVERAEHPHAGGLGDRERHARRSDLGQGAGIGPRRRRAGLDHAEAAGRQRRGALRRDGDDERGGKQMRLLADGDRGAVEGRRALATADEGSLHRPGKVGRGIGRGADPVEPRIARQRHAREVAVVGAGLERLGAPGREREVDGPFAVKLIHTLPRTG